MVALLSIAVFCNFLFLIMTAYMIPNRRWGIHPKLVKSLGDSDGKDKLYYYHFISTKFFAAFAIVMLLSLGLLFLPLNWHDPWVYTFPISLVGAPLLAVGIQLFTTFPKDAETRPIKLYWGLILGHTSILVLWTSFVTLSAVAFSTGS